MTQAAQSALRRGKLPDSWHLTADSHVSLVIETHTKNVRFCILCNYVNKISPAIQSRCTRFPVLPITGEGSGEEGRSGGGERGVSRKLFQLLLRLINVTDRSHLQGQSSSRWSRGSPETVKRRYAPGSKRPAGASRSASLAIFLLPTAHSRHLQACHAAHDRIDVTAVYNCTGNPDPKDIERVIQSMMSDEFGTAFTRESICLPVPSSLTRYIQSNA